MSQLFIDHARSIAQLSGLPLVVISTTEQIGDSFGERFSNAIQNVLDRGFQNVISIGNDCLSLSPSDINKAEKALNSGKSVVGQSKSGGAYLIGISKSDFHLTDFEQLNWNTPRLFDSLMSYLSESSTETLQLAVKTDVNASPDLKIALKELPLSSAIRIMVESIWSQYTFPLPKGEVIESFFCSRVEPSRAPPLASLL